MLFQFFCHLRISQLTFGGSNSPSLSWPLRKVCWQHDNNNTLVLNVDGGARWIRDKQTMVVLCVITLTSNFNLVSMIVWFVKRFTCRDSNSNRNYSPLVSVLQKNYVIFWFSPCSSFSGKRDTEISLLCQPLRANSKLSS